MMRKRSGRSLRGTRQCRTVVFKKDAKGRKLPKRDWRRVKLCS